MIILVSAIILFLLSFFLALKSVGSEFSAPEEVRKLKVARKKKVSGVILFLKKKIIHYSSSSS